MLTSLKKESVWTHTAPNSSLLSSLLQWKQGFFSGQPALGLGGGWGLLSTDSHQQAWEKHNRYPDEATCVRGLWTRGMEETPSSDFSVVICKEPGQAQHGIIAGVPFQTPPCHPLFPLPFQ